MLVREPSHDSFRLLARLCPQHALARLCPELPLSLSVTITVNWVAHLG